MVARTAGKNANMRSAAIAKLLNSPSSSYRMRNLWWRARRTRSDPGRRRLHGWLRNGVATNRARCLPAVRPLQPE